MPLFIAYCSELPLPGDTSSCYPACIGMSNSYDVAVIGVGTMGSYACCELARRGVNVVGLDRFSPPHDHGSHSGDTRVFRLAYAEHPDYVPLAQRAGELWDQLGVEAGVSLIHRCGMLSIGPPDSVMIQGIETSSLRHGIVHTRHTAEEVRRLFPAIEPAPDQVGIFEPSAGWLDVRVAIETARRFSREAGATLLTDRPVLDVATRGGLFAIATTGGEIISERVIVTAGAWSSQLLSRLGLPLHVERKVLLWVDPLEPKRFAPGALPIFACAERFFYGFPSIGGHGVKVAIHWEKGQTVDDPTTAVAPATLADIEPVLEMASRYVPSLAGRLPAALDRVTALKTCLYTMTPDEHFIIDRHPEWANLVFATGFSGHGFKFAPVIGEALADLVMFGKSALPVEFLRIGSRFDNKPGASA
jgi:sarcosine oxidase